MLGCSADSPEQFRMDKLIKGPPLMGLGLGEGIVTRSYAAPLTTHLYNPRISGSIVHQ
jgi:hypothetical protein